MQTRSATQNRLPRNAELESGAAERIYRERDPELGKLPQSVINRLEVSRGRRVIEALDDVRAAEKRLLGQGKTFEALSTMANAEVPLEDVMNTLRLAYVSNVIMACAGNQCLAAKRLGIHRNTLSRILGADF